MGKLKKIIKNNNGSAFVLVMFIGTMLVLLTPVLMTLWDANTNSHFNTKKINESYYLARTGTEIALDYIGVKKGVLRDNLFLESDEIYLYGDSFSNLSVSHNNEDNKNETNNLFVKIQDTGSDYIKIESTSTKNDKTSNVNVLVDKIKSETSELNIVDLLGFTVFAIADQKTFSNNILELTGSSSITGNIGTNAIEQNTVSLGWSTSIDGDFVVGVGGDYNNIINTANNIYNIITGDVSTLSEVKTYPEIISPEIPIDLPDKGSLTTSWTPTGKHTIDSDGFYSSISVIANRTLEIDLNNKKRVLVVEDLNIQQGEVNLINAGDEGVLKIYVLDNLSLGGSSKFNEGEDSSIVDVYYFGSESLSFTDNQVFNGNLFVESSDFTIGGSTSFYGHILSNGENITVTGNADARNHMIYAPNSRVVAQGSGTIENVIIGRKIALTGNSHVDFNEDIGFKNIKNSFPFYLLGINQGSVEEIEGFSLLWY